MGKSSLKLPNFDMKMTKFGRGGEGGGGRAHWATPSDVLSNKPVFPLRQPRFKGNFFKSESPMLLEHTVIFKNDQQ